MRWERCESTVAGPLDRRETSARGWLYESKDGPCLGHYLEYPTGHHRSGHDNCEPGRCECRRSHPGNVCAASTVTHASRYFETPAAAREWIEAQASEMTT